MAAAATRLAFSLHSCCTATALASTAAVSNSKPPLIILHGVFGSKMNWTSLAKNLIKRLAERNVYLLDARNHGESPHLSEMSYHSMTQDTALFIHQHVQSSPPKCILMGHSMGGKTAMLLALTYPELVERLIVVDVAPVKSPGHIIQYIEAMKTIDLESLVSRAEARSLLQDSIQNKAVREFLLTNLKKRRAGGYQWAFNLQAIEDNMDALSSFPIINQQQQQYTGPALFVGGSNSPYIKSSVYSDIEKLFPQALITHIEGAGHWVHADKPKELLDVLHQFMESK